MKSISPARRMIIFGIWKQVIRRGTQRPASLRTDWQGDLQRPQIRYLVYERDCFAKSRIPMRYCMSSSISCPLKTFLILRCRFFLKGQVTFLKLCLHIVRMALSIASISSGDASKFNAAQYINKLVKRANGYKMHFSAWKRILIKTKG